MFKPQFAPAVAAGTKRCTIRPTPKRAINAGDVLDAREWTGRPYNSKQNRLREAVIERVTPITIEASFCVILGGKNLTYEKITRLAREDGFEGFAGIMEFFQTEHGLPFTGVLIEWAP